MKVVFTGGGTAGHVFPGLAVAEQLKKMAEDKNQTLVLAWIGSKKESEKKLVFDYGIDFYPISTGKLRRYFSLRNVLDFFSVITGIFQSIFLLLKIKPDLVFSKGGFVSVPPCVAAKLLGVPIYVHESDFSPGLTTKITSRFAKKIFVSYNETQKLFSTRLQKNCVYTGNPVREKFCTATADAGRAFLGCNKSNKKILLIMGGSSGAKQINDLVYETATELCKNFFVVHQLGRVNFSQHLEIEKKLSEIDSQLLKNYKAFDFINAEMPSVLVASDLVVSRAGANALWEIISVGKPSILIPLGAESSRGDQIENAEFFASKGCCEVLCGNDINSKNFLRIIESFLTDKTKFIKMSKASKELLPEPATIKIAKLILENEGVK